MNQQSIRYQKVAGALLALFVLGIMLLAPTAQASSQEISELPKVNAAAQLVLGALKEKVVAEPQLLAAATVSDPQIAALMKLLEQLIVMYNAILAAQGENIDDNHSDDSEDEENDVSLRILSPNGGETYVAGESVIHIKYRSSGIEGETVTAYLFHPEEGYVQSVRYNVVSAKDVNAIDMYLSKGDAEAGRYKINLCAHDVQGPNGKNLCDLSDDYFELVDPDGDSRVVSSFSYEQEYYGDVGEMNVDFEYTIDNYHSGLVLDVEPKVNCDDSLLTQSFYRSCAHYLFDLSGKAAEKYQGVQANPFVKGGALYRFTGSNGHLYIKGYVDPNFEGNAIPDNIDFEFILRDLNQGGIEIWSDTRRAQFKG